MQSFQVHRGYVLVQKESTVNQEWLKKDINNTKVNEKSHKVIIFYKIRTK